MNNKEEEIQRLFDMQEYPENYTEKQFRELLEDDDVKSFVKDMSEVKQAMHKDSSDDVDIDKEWAEFAAKHNVRHHRRRLNIAAISVGILFVAGAAFAAIHFNVFSPTNITETDSTLVSQSKNAVVDSVKVGDIEEKDTVDLSPVVFEDTELGDILKQMAAYYNVNVNVVNEGAANIRLYFKWNKTLSLRRNVDILNGFDHISITLKDNQLTVE